jgi:hypothetical protein
MAYIGYGQSSTPSSRPPPLDRSDQPGSSGYGGGSSVPSFTEANPNSGQNQLGGLFSQWMSGYWNPSQMLGQAQLNELERQKGLTGLQSDLASQLQNQQAGWGLQDTGLSREGLGVQQGALARQMGLLPQQYGIQQQQFGLQLEGIGYQRKQADLNFHEQQAQQKDASKMLGIQAKRLDLSEDEIRGRLQNALNQIGIGNQISVDQLLQEQYKTSQGMLSPLQGLFSNIYSIGGITVPSGIGGM